MKLVFQEIFKFIYSFLTQFSRVAYYVSRLSQALKLTSLSSKSIYIFLKLVEKYIRLKVNVDEVKRKLMLL